MRTWRNYLAGRGASAKSKPPWCCAPNSCSLLTSDVSSPSMPLHVSLGANPVPLRHKTTVSQWDQ